jgi:hypothetical protein
VGGGGGRGRKLRIDLNADGFLAHRLYKRLQQAVQLQRKWRDENRACVAAGVGNLLQTGVPTVGKHGGGRNFGITITRSFYVHRTNYAYIFV